MKSIRHRRALYEPLEYGADEDQNSCDEHCPLKGQSEEILGERDRLSKPWKGSHRFQRCGGHVITGRAVLGLVTLSLIMPLTIYLVFPWSMLLQESASTYHAEIQAVRAVTVPPNVCITAVIMNHARPRILREISTLLPTLIRHPNVCRILLLHSNRETQFLYGHPKVVNIDATETNSHLGLAIRFYYGARNCTTEWVLMVDDDMECDSTAIDDVLRAATYQGDRIIGKYGRLYHYGSAPLRHGYHTYNVRGHVEVVLTKFMLIPRTICEAFLQYQNIMADVVVRSHPLWNGEDIFANLVANRVYHVPPAGPFRHWAMTDLAVWEVAEKVPGTSVSGDMDRIRPWNTNPMQLVEAIWKSQKQHAYYRGEFWAIAKERLAAKY